MRYVMPPEWAQQEKVFMQWPRVDPIWDGHLDAARKAFAIVARAILSFAPVCVIVDPHDCASAKAMLPASATKVMLPINDCWFRDTGCTFVIDKSENLICGIDWQHNGWGQKFAGYECDNAVSRNLLKTLRVPRIDADFVMEGGAFHTNGAGLLLTTEPCFYDTLRNPAKSFGKMEATMKRLLGISQMIVLPHGLLGDHTGGHIDNVACFCDEKTVLIAWTNDTLDPNYPNLVANRRIIEATGLDVIPVILPLASDKDGKRLPFSYLNFLFVNGGVILPIFGGDFAAYDQQVIEQFEKLFFDRTIVPIYSRDIVRGGGNIHCITQQMPLCQGA